MGLVWGKLSLGHEITDNSNFTVAKKAKDEVKLGIQILLIKSHKQYIRKAGRQPHKMPSQRTKHHISMTLMGNLIFFKEKNAHPCHHFIMQNKI